MKDSQLRCVGAVGHHRTHASGPVSAYSLHMTSKTSWFYPFLFDRTISSTFFLNSSGEGWIKHLHKFRTCLWNRFPRENTVTLTRERSVRGRSLPCESGGESSHLVHLILRSLPSDIRKLAYAPMNFMKICRFPENWESWTHKVVPQDLIVLGHSF